MTFELDKVMYDTIKGDASIVADVSDRISAEYARHTSEYPYLVFDHVSTSVEPPGFGSASGLLHRALYEIRVVGRWEDGVEDIAKTSDKVVALFHYSSSESVTNFDRLVLTVLSGTTVTRADDELIASVTIQATGNQTTGL